MLITSSLMYAFSIRAAQKQLDLQTNANLVQIKDGIKKMVEQYQTVAVALADDINIIEYLQRGGNSYYAANYAAFLLTNGKSNHVSVHVLSVSNSNFISTTNLPKRYQYPFNRNWGIFRMIETGDGPVVYTNNKDSRDSDTIFSIGYPVKNSSNLLVGYVIVDLNRECVEDWIFAKTTANYGFHIAILDHNSFVAYNSIDSTLEGLGVLPSYVPTPITTGRYPVEIYGEKYQLRIESLSVMNLLIAYDVPVYQVVQDTRHIGGTAIIISAVSLLVCAIFSLIIAKNISKPIHLLSDAMKDVETGNFDIRLDFKREDEIGLLDRKFNHMAKRIKLLVQRIENEQISLRIAETKALQAQIQPHFLYNTLDIIKWSAKLNQNDIVQSVAVRLGKLLRAVMRTDAVFFTIAEELEITEQYLAIQKLRYGDILEIQIEQSQGLDDFLVPKLMLQPLVENAIEHGIEGKQGIGLMKISVAIREEYLIFIVEDNGRGMDDAELLQLRKSLTRDSNQNDSNSSGIGLYNVNLRAKLYGDENCGIVIASAINCGTTVTLTLPNKLRQARLNEFEG